MGLAKLCARHAVPRPPRGHWARLQHGKPVHKVPLPPAEDEALHSVTIDPDRPTATRAVRASTSPEGVPAAKESKPPAGPRVAIALDDPHPLVARTAKSIRSAKACYGSLPKLRGGVCPCQGEWGLQLGHAPLGRVDRSQITRAAGAAGWRGVPEAIVGPPKSWPGQGLRHGLVFGPHRGWESASRPAALKGNLDTVHQCPIHALLTQPWRKALRRAFEQTIHPSEVTRKLH